MRNALATIRLGSNDNPNALYAGVGHMVVSIYTYLPYKAREIASKAGNGVPPVFHDEYSLMGKVKPGRYRHYHNGQMMALYPPKPNEKNEKLPHSFFGDWVWWI